jgi:hypothetical protein
LLACDTRGVIEVTIRFVQPRDVDELERLRGTVYDVVWVDLDHVERDSSRVRPETIAAADIVGPGGVHVQQLLADETAVWRIVGTAEDDAAPTLADGLLLHGFAFVVEAQFPERGELRFWAPGSGLVTVVEADPFGQPIDAAVVLPDLVALGDQLWGIDLTRSPRG